MPFDPSGFFNRVRNWQQDAANGVKIRADYHDAEDDGFATALSLTICRDGRSTVSANIPWSGRKITNLGDPVDPQDAATLKSVNNLRNFSTSITIQGADANGRITFSATGVNGLNWTVADVSWLAKKAETSKTSDRLVMNNSGASNSGLATGGAGTDVFIIDDAGRINNVGVISQNLSWDGAAWRTISPGFGTAMSYADGSFRLLSNDTATITNPYVSATLREYFRAVNTAGSCSIQMVKSGTGKLAQIVAYNNTELRWSMTLGDATAESSTRTGSNFSITSYDNTGAGGATEMTINRASHAVSFLGSVTSAGTITSGNNFDSTSTTCIVSATAGGAVYLRPDGPTDATSSFSIDTNGNARVCDGVASATGGVQAGKGLASKVGMTGSYDLNHWVNFYWSGTQVRLYIDNIDQGGIAYSCDYRTKKDITPLPSMWDKVKTLRPVQYSIRDWEIFRNDDTPRWGFVAHELQEKLIESAASGRKDEANTVQQPDLLAVVAALTKALQEAMTRIEALEATT